MKISRKRVFILVLTTFLSLIIFKTVQYNTNYKNRLAVYNTGIGAFKSKMDYIRKLNKLLPENEQDDTLLELHKIVSESDVEDLLNGRTMLKTWNVAIVNNRIDEIKKVLAKLDIEYEKIYIKISH